MAKNITKIKRLVLSFFISLVIMLALAALVILHDRGIDILPYVWGAVCFIVAFVGTYEVICSFNLFE